MQYTDTASAGNGGVATASANGGAVGIGDVNSGGNAGNAIGVGDTWGGTFSDNSRDLAALAGVNDDGTYEYDLGSASRPTWDPLFKYDASSNFPSRVVSRWSVLLTLRYEF